MKATEFLFLVKRSFENESLKKLVFSRPENSEVNKISCRLVAHRGKRLLAMEYSLPGNTVSHKNLGEEDLQNELMPIIKTYRQANLITTEGEAEWHIAKSGKEALLGGEKLRRRLKLRYGITSLAGIL